MKQLSNQTSELRFSKQILASTGVIPHVSLKIKVLELSSLLNTENIKPGTFYWERKGIHMP